VGELIVDDDVARPEQPRHHADAGRVARREDETGLAPVERRHPLLQLAQVPIRSGQELGRGRAVSHDVEGARVEVEAEVAVRVEAQHLVEAAGKRMADADAVIERAFEHDAVLRLVDVSTAQVVDEGAEARALIEQVAKGGRRGKCRHRHDGTSAGRPPAAAVTLRAVSHSGSGLLFAVYCTVDDKQQT
jgi:hypothetical protein